MIHEIQSEPAPTSDPAVGCSAIVRRQVEGRVKFLYSTGERKCACCPGGLHAFGRFIEFEKFEHRSPEHFRRDASLFAEETACLHEFVGKRVVVTVEVYDA